jgi:hypothetical protein
MKRYWLFGGQDCYPEGGMGDFRGSFDSLEEAVEAGNSIKCIVGRFYHVFDSQEFSIAKEREIAQQSFDEWHKDLRVE